ncbi:hypothetical protein L3V82_04150 [Thiotrichales bacterium 19S3-7]|nr:hypothetical protein [Thiotrichales bacterium 19S3-7]MCF6801867.1 hypothetical protein [Thiotrichales bacterium 19S3-11]
MKNIIIVGSGPIGLYNALKLSQLKKKYNLDINISVVDARSGEYERSRIVAKAVAMEIEQGLGHDLKGIRSADDIGNAIYIQDVEQALYKLALQEGIHFEKANFKTFDSKNVVVETKSSILKTLNSDLVLDCTGSSRAVVKEVNKLTNGESFTVSPIGNNPIKSHFSAYVTMTDDQVQLMHSPEERDPVKHAIAMATLRKKYGWEHFSEPFFEMRTLDIGQGKKRVYLYYEIPENLASQSVEVKKEYLKDLLNLKMQHTDIQFELEESKYSFGAFPVDPHKVDELGFKGNGEIPQVYPCGDAQVEPDYRLGVGIRSGVMRANALWNSIQLTHDRGIKINDEQYAYTIGQVLSWHILNLESDYKQRHSALISKLADVLDEHLVALEILSESEENALIEEYKVTIKASISELAGELKSLADKAFRGESPYTSKSIDQCFSYYRKALNAYESIGDIDNQIKLNSNMAIYSKIENKYTKTLEYTQKALELNSNAAKTTPEDTQIINKVLYNQAYALFKIALSQLSSNDEGVHDTFSLLVDTAIDLETRLGTQDKFVKQINKFKLTVEEELSKQKQSASVPVLIFSHNTSYSVQQTQGITVNS